MSVSNVVKLVSPQLVSLSEEELKRAYREGGMVFVENHGSCHVKMHDAEKIILAVERPCREDEDGKLINRLVYHADPRPNDNLDMNDVSPLQLVHWCDEENAKYLYNLLYNTRAFGEFHSVPDFLLALGHLKGLFFAFLARWQVTRGLRCPEFYCTDPNIASGLRCSLNTVTNLFKYATEQEFMTTRTERKKGKTYRWICVNWQRVCRVALKKDRRFQENLANEAYEQHYKTRTKKPYPKVGGMVG